LVNTINYSSISKPFIITAVILLFIGSSIGSIWMMSIFGVASLPTWLPSTSELHKMLQIDGFLTLLIMGIGYMIIQRFRNIQLASSKLAHTSFFLILASLVMQAVQITDSSKNLLT
jgi:cbb3-type cytochrome oxidase subunit 1